MRLDCYARGRMSGKGREQPFMRGRQLSATIQRAEIIPTPLYAVWSGWAAGSGIAIENAADPRHQLFAEGVHRALDHVVGHRTELEDHRQSHQSSWRDRRRRAVATVSALPRITMSLAAISSE